MTNYKIDSRPIEGSTYKEPEPVDQLDAQGFLDLIDAVLAVEGVEAIRWNQYTPFFNDGDPCEFSVGEASVKLSETFEVDEEAEDGFVDSYSLFSYTPGYDWNGGPNRQDFATGAEYTEAFRVYREKNQEFTLNGHPTKAIYDALTAFNEKTEAFESVAKSNFGDHAEVTATEDGFEVEYYEHD